SSPVAGDWQGITFTSGSTSNVMDQTVIKYASYGIQCYTSSLTLSNSTISNNAYGIYAASASPAITGNAISGNDTGIKLSSASPTITGNTISSNRSYGIYCSGEIFALIDGNAIAENIGYGLYNAGNSVMDAENNYWGHFSGPYDPSDDRAAGGWYNPGGLGDKVSDRIDYEPWRSIPVSAADFDGDGDCDGSDLAQLVTEFGREDCSTDCPCCCDLDRDGCVDEIDIFLFAEDFGRF
ncbi:MAG: NosD domain-containing protein, partial [Pseudomonadota bacterium]